MRLTSLLILVSLLASCANPDSGSSILRVLAIGDSNTRQETSIDTYCELSRFDCFNAVTGRRGDLFGSYSEQWADRRFFLSRVPFESFDICSIMLGGREVQRGFSADEFESNIRAIVGYCLDQAEIVVLHRIIPSPIIEEAPLLAEFNSRLETIASGDERVFVGVYPQDFAFLEFSDDFHIDEDSQTKLTRYTDAAFSAAWSE